MLVEVDVDVDVVVVMAVAARRAWYRKWTSSNAMSHRRTATSTGAPPTGSIAPIPEPEPMSGSMSTRESTRSAAPAARVNELSTLLSA